MSYKEYILQKVIPTYFMLVTFLVLFICLTGVILEPEALFGYEALLSPLIYAGIGIIPMMFLYSPKELSIRQVLVRKAINLILVLGLILGFTIAMGVIHDWIGGMVVAVGVCITSFIVNILLYIMEQRTARRLTRALSRIPESME